MLELTVVANLVRASRLTLGETKDLYRTLGR